MRTPSYLLIEERRIEKARRAGAREWRKELRGERIETESDPRRTHTPTTSQAHDPLTAGISRPISVMIQRIGGDCARNPRHPLPRYIRTPFRG